MTINPIIVAAGLLLLVSLKVAHQRSDTRFLARVKKISDTSNPQSKDQF